jgi:hypothetical protein
MTFFIFVAPAFFRARTVRAGVVMQRSANELSSWHARIVEHRESEIN